MRWRDIPAAIAASGRNYVCGRVSRAFTLRVIGPLTNGGFAVGTMLAIACLPTSYDVRHAWVSSLASARTNPSGYFYLGTTLMVVAVLLVPLPGHLSRQFRTRGRVSVAGSLLLWVGIVGLFLLSVETTVFPNPGRTRFVHQLFTAITLIFLTLVVAAPALSLTAAAWVPNLQGLVLFACGGLLVGYALGSVRLRHYAAHTLWFLRATAVSGVAAVIARFVGGYLTAWAAPRDGSRPPP